MISEHVDKGSEYPHNLSGCFVLDGLSALMHGPGPYISSQSIEVPSREFLAGKVSSIHAFTNALNLDCR